MKKLIVLSCCILLIGCSVTQSNIRIDAIQTFNLDNYSEFNIKINSSDISAEINPIVLENFRDKLRSSIEERGLSYSKNSSLVFEINFTTKETVEERFNHYYSRYYWDNYLYRDNIVTVTENILRINLKNIKDDKTVWTVITVWRDGSQRSISSDDATDILVDEIMLSFM